MNTPICPPRSLRNLGLVNIAFGLLVTPVNGMLVWFGIAKLRELGSSAGATAPLWLTLAVYLTGGLVLVLAGIGLCQSALWGRLLSLIGAGSLFVAVLVAGVCVQLAWDRAKMEYSGPLVEVTIWGGVPALWPAYGVVLLVMLNLPPVRNWDRGMRCLRRGLPPEQSFAESRVRSMSTLAAVTMVLALTPAVGLTQLAALGTGFIALLRIHRSNGTLAGTGLALVGIVFSVVIIVGCVAWLVMSHWATGTLPASMILTAIGGLLAIPLIPLLVGGEHPVLDNMAEKGGIQNLHALVPSPKETSP